MANIEEGKPEPVEAGSVEERLQDLACRLEWLEEGVRTLVTWAGELRKRPLRLAEPAERGAVAARIDPATAEVWGRWGWVRDPYGDLGPAEEDNYGSLWFAHDPVERIAVSFYDLPQATVKALYDRRAEPPL